MGINFNEFFREELPINDIQKAMGNGEVSSKELVMYYLSRIAKYDQDGPKINSILEINPDAIFIAEALDYERVTKGVRGPLHGIPVFIKDNIETNDSMHTSAGTIALENNISGKDAFLVKKLRKAGAVILGKTNMTELANGMSFEMWAGYSSRGGQVLNPYGDANLYVGGSSSGSAVAVATNFTVLSVGTETDASILSPAVTNSVVGIKPTVGLVSRSGIIPFTYSQDTAGPFARTVTDAAILLGTLAGVDKADPATHKNEGRLQQDYTVYLDSMGLKDAKIGVFNKASNDYYDSEEYDEALFNNVIQTLRNEGAQVFENIEIPSFHREWSWGVSLYELKHSLDNYLSKLPSNTPVHSIAELIQFNKNIEEKALKYGQNKLELRESFPNTLRNPEYLNAKLEDLYFSQEQGIDFALKKYNLDAILFPSYIGSTICAKAGYPSIAIPAGYMKSGRPFGVTLASTAFSEGVLIKLAFAFEQATKHRRSPKITC
ncbi:MULTISPECIES: amidase family protein [unclassified Peribacillus]|uniref:amidase family protein n=1 Tax=unclassified Peribacillus TaxID=2675266 RepID=UPI001913B3E4|nr:MULTISPECIES: amidase family protein [unclassified Peribacillus]MBK5501731.1 amidase [Peribacillus sp. TH14]WMX53351.1 amidase family protein [Peribacillus sp. R9-11]